MAKDPRLFLVTFLLGGTAGGLGVYSRDWRVLGGLVVAALVLDAAVDSRFRRLVGAEASPRKLTPVQRISVAIALVLVGFCCLVGVFVLLPDPYQEAVVERVLPYWIATREERVLTRAAMRAFPGARRSWAPMVISFDVAGGKCSFDVSEILLDSPGFLGGPAGGGKGAGGPQWFESPEGSRMPTLCHVTLKPQGFDYRCHFWYENKSSEYVKENREKIEKELMGAVEKYLQSLEEEK